MRTTTGFRTSTPLTGVVQLAGKNGAPRNFIPTDYLDFAPRFGFAYALTSDTVIRGGYGISYVNANNFVSYIGANPPYTQSFTLVNLSFKNYQAINLLSQGLPTGLAPTTANFNPNQPAGNYDEAGVNNRTPYTQSFSLNLQRALPGNFVVEAGYVGTKGTRLPGEVDGDPAAPGNPATEQQRRIYAATLPNVTGITDYINAFSSTYNSSAGQSGKAFLARPSVSFHLHFLEIHRQRERKPGDRRRRFQFFQLHAEPV